MKSETLSKSTKRKSNGAGARTLAEKLEPFARDVRFKEGALHVFLADGREVSAPLEWFPRLLKANTKQRSRWELMGDGIGIHWPDVDEDIEVESLLAI
jgi:hypothetical protein